jgi:hypothetical protein
MEMLEIGLLTEDGAILDQRLRDLLSEYSDINPAPPAGLQHAAVAHGALLPLMVQAGAGVTPLRDMPTLQIEITVRGGEDDFYERLERLLRETRDGSS